jgi:hypothetical protein
MLTDLFILPTMLLVLSLTHIHDEATGVYASGVGTVLDLMAQSYLTVGIVLIEYLLFAGFCIPFWLSGSMASGANALLVF